MKTNHNTPTRSTANAHNEQTAADTNNTKNYRVVLYYTQTCEAVLNIKADSLAQAKALANEIESEQLTDDILNPISGEIVIDSIELIDGGKTDE